MPVSLSIWLGALSLGICALLILGLRLWRRLAQDGAAELRTLLREELRLQREDYARESRALREELARQQKDAGDSLLNMLAKLGETQNTRLVEVSRHLQEWGETHRRDAQHLRDTLEAQFKLIQQSNEQKLEQMRQTVDEKLHLTLEKRLGESFKIVSEHLQAVQKGLGEMQQLAGGVGDLKRVLTNVKTRGTWGEIQLAAILEQLFLPDQYERNVHVKPRSPEQVEFALRLPGRGGAEDGPVWLPIDSKFPKEAYERLLDASQAADVAGVEAATKELARQILKSARDIFEKYIAPPHTTDFAILFLPTEGLYAEVLRQPGLHDELQQKYHVLPAGPTTLAALLNSLRMGFRTLAIEKRSAEVWRVLAAVKTEFGKFGEVLEKVHLHLENAAASIEKTSARSRLLENKLKQVELLPENQARELLDLPGETP